VRHSGDTVTLWIFQSCWSLMLWKNCGVEDSYRTFMEPGYTRKGTRVHAERRAG
jgi:hypothetical protein